MVAAALKQSSLLPRAAGGNAPGAALALLVHAGLIVALTVGVDWRSHQPEVVSAELWAAVPQSAAPPPVVQAPPPPPPPPVQREQIRPDADIATEQERKRVAQAERKKTELDAEAERKRNLDKKKADDERKKREQAEAEEKAQDARLANQREENLRRMMGQAGGTPGQTAPTGTAAQNAAPSASYAGKVKAAVRPEIVFTGTVAGNAAAEVEVSAAPGGSIISRRLIKSSGNKEWDEAVLRAIDKTRAMPRDTDGRVPPSLIISFKQSE